MFSWIERLIREATSGTSAFDATSSKIKRGSISVVNVVSELSVVVVVAAGSEEEEEEKEFEERREEAS